MAVSSIVDKKIVSSDAGQQVARRVFCVLSRHRSALFDRFGLDRLAVFGSTVRGEHRRGSDIDILVRFVPEKVKDFDSESSDYYGVLFEIKEALSTILNRKRIDVSDERHLCPQYRESILEEAVDVPAAGEPFVFEKRGPMEKTVKKYFEDIKDASGYIKEKIQHKSLEDYLNDRDLRQIVERNLEIIGEAVGKASKIDPSVREDLPEAGKLIGLRNQLIHGYDSIIHPKIYRNVKELLPDLERKVDERLNVLSNQEKEREEKKEAPQRSRQRGRDGMGF
ncbi:MAG: HepT-like ribonuclease domain-containing protein [Nitrososphaerales archaeon]